MSGGSFGYLCYEIEEKYVGEMHDLELDALMHDLAKLLHDLEWWQSGDYGEESYRMAGLLLIGRNTRMKTPDLRPCPFCGCKYEKDDDDYFWAGDHEAWCPLGKEYPGQLGNLIVPDEKECIEAWNRRVSDENA